MITRMKKIGLRTAALLCGAGLVVASAQAQDQSAPPPPDGQQQGPPPGGMRGGMRGGNPEMRASMLQKQLGLTDEVTTQVKAILMDSSAKMQALRDTAGSPADKRPQMMSIHQAEVTQVKALLTPDQATKYDAMEERMRQRGPGGPPPSSDGSVPPPPPQQ
jgi:protein CpxP